MGFRFESLKVWPLALEYVDACFILAQRFPQSTQYSIGEQLRRAATSITANIAEGSAKSTPRSERNFYDIARGSVAETVALLALAHRRHLISQDHYDRMYGRANLISSMLHGLIHSDDKIKEAAEPYTVPNHSLDLIFASSPLRLDALPDPQPWTTRSTRTAFANQWLAVEIDDVVLPNGHEYEYTRLTPRAPGVGVIGFNEDGLILLEREYRHGVGEVIWQIPGGLADPDEDLRAGALRELCEETGHMPAAINDETVRYLGQVWDNPAFGPMHSHLFAAWGLTQITESRRDPAEFVTLHWVSPDWLKEAIRNGEIRDRVVIAAVAWLLLGGWI